jgi:hypothetical protein
MVRPFACFGPGARKRLTVCRRARKFPPAQLEAKALARALVQQRSARREDYAWVEVRWHGAVFYRGCLQLALNMRADPAERCLLLGEKRKQRRRAPISASDP